MCLFIWPTLFIQETSNGSESSHVGSWVAFYFGIDCQSMIMWMTGYDELIIMSEKIGKYLLPIGIIIATGLYDEISLCIKIELEMDYFVCLYIINSF